MLERHTLVAGLHAVDSLVVAADVFAAELANVAIHDGFGFAETIPQFDGVALGLKAAEILGLEGNELVEVPRRQSVNAVFGQPLRGVNQHVVEKVLDFSANRGPART